MTSSVLVGYARVSTDTQDLTAQRDALQALGVPARLVYSDKGMTGTNRDRPGLREALAACREGDTLVVTKLDRLNLGGAVYDPTDPVGRLLFNVLGMVAEFESDLIRARTREGMAVAKVRGKLKGRKPKLSPAQERHLVALHRAGDHSVSELVELFGIGRATVYRALDRHPVTTSTEVTLPRVDDEPTS
ncbi:recombinase family protein [Clavibacter michiganensis]|uniref:recombinase family protein n=1 Tax=Clavibacter michiganensis TaxID=28447 RepID=UPI00375711B7